MKKAVIYTRVSTDTRSLYGEKLAYDQRPDFRKNRFAASPSSVGGALSEFTQTA